MSFHSLLISSCAIQLNTPTQDTYGQMIESWADIAGLTAVKCRIDIIGGGLNKTPREVYEKATHIIFMAPQSAITLNTKDHRIVIGSDYYTILLIDKVYDSVGIDHYEIVAEKVT